MIYPGNKMVRPEYKSLFGATKVSLKYNWITELSKAFHINLNLERIANGDLFLEQKEFGIPSIYIYYEDFLHSVFPGLGFYKLKLEDIHNVELTRVHIKGAK